MTARQACLEQFAKFEKSSFPSTYYIIEIVIQAVHFSAAAGGGGGFCTCCDTCPCAPITDVFQELRDQLSSYFNSTISH